jgi:hypothetical protein
VRVVHGGAIDIRRRALALALLLHAALLGSVLRRAPQAPQAPARTMVWLKLAPAVRRPVMAPPPPVVRTPLRRPAPTLAAPAPAPMPSIAEPQPVVEAAPAPISAEQMLSIAKRDLGKIDRELRKQQPAKGFGAAPDSAQQRLEKGFDEAHAAAPNKWYQAARVEDITPPGDDARKIYRITGVLGSYCVRYADKNRANQGKANAGAPLIGACPHMFK